MKILNIKSIKPLFNTVITTADKYEEDAMIGDIIDASKQQGTLKEYQTVVAVGSVVRDIKVGDLVSIDPTRFAVKKYDKDSIRQDIAGGNPVVGYNFDFITMDNKTYLMIQDRDVEFIISEYEEIDNSPSDIITTTIPPIIV
jgi:co-chaperonin GroES (HSP10)